MEIPKERIIYDSETSKLVAKANGDVIQLTQYLGDEVFGEINMYYDEISELNDFKNSIKQQEREN